MKILTFLSSLRKNNIADFEKTFFYLERTEKKIPSSKICFNLLKKLNVKTSDLESDTLINELLKIRHPSNPTDYFYFFFPIVSHILYYKPKYEKEILKYLIGPNFANGTSDAEEMIGTINRAMKYKLSENRYFLSKESQDWITNELPKLEKEVQREIDICWKELDE